jgi:hypothetical protein
MLTSRLTHLTLRAAAVFALLVTSAGTAAAQKAKIQDDQAAGKSVLTLAREDPESMLKGIALNAIEKKAVRDIERRFAKEFNALEWEFKAALKAGKKDAPVFAKVEVLRSQQRSELRSILTKEQQAAFDSNMAAQ